MSIYSYRYVRNDPDYIDEILRQAQSLIGQTVTVRLSSGADLEGTLTGFDGVPVAWPSGTPAPHNAIVVTATTGGKVWHIRPDAVLAIAG